MKRLSLKKEWHLLYAIGIALFLAMMVGCNLFSPSTGSTANVFAVSSKNGSVYEIDTDANPPSAATTALVSIGQNSTGEMVIHGSKAFLAVGSYSNTAPGLYWFDLSSSNPTTAQIGNNISAQYICIASDTVGYVSSSDYMGTYSNTVYRFDPSDPSAGLGSEVTGFATSNFHPQDITYVDDGSGAGRVFVTDNGNGKVYRLNDTGTAVDLTFTTSAGGTTGLLAGSYDWNNDSVTEKGVFVANTGGYGPAPDYAALPGALDFIPLDAISSSDIATVQSSLSVGRLAAFSTNELIATNYGHTYLIDLTKASGGTDRVTEIKNSSDTSFGSLDVNIYDGYAYVPDGATTLYRINSSGSVTAISVGVSGELISNVAVKE